MIDINPEYAQADLYKQLNDLRANNKALHSPELGAPMMRIAADNEHIFACVRYAEGQTNTVIAVMNMSGEEQTVTLDLTEYVGKYDCTCGKEIQLEATQTFQLKPWEYKIFTK
mgnify:FL=1